MFKIKIISNTKESIYEFERNEIIIGGTKTEFADLTLKKIENKNEHIKLICDNGKYFVINATNDPLISLNDLPFHKKEIKFNDIIQFGSYKIELLPTLEKLKKISNVNLEELEVNLTDDEVETANIDELLKEVTLFENQDNCAKTEEKKIEKVIAKKIKNTEPATYYLKDFDDESENWNISNEPNVEKTYIVDLKSYLFLFLAVVVLGTLILSGVYYRENDRNSQEEKKLAAGISDIAMAMTYSKIYHIFPNKQNWTDPDFIRNNLSFVLAPNLHTQAQINSQGQFYKYPYILRVYVGTNHSNFLIIAQPSSSLLHWFVYKKSLVIDSRSMEIRKLADLKEINRLLANPKPLEGQNGDEIYKVVKNGHLMPITSLAGIKNRWGFIPPKALSLMRPKAENFIYNAPRYYPFGEEVLNKAVQLLDSQASNLQVIELKEDMEEISKFNDMVLYTSKGFNHASEAQKSISTFVPNVQFLIAYVKFNSSGFVSNSNLLINAGQNEFEQEFDDDNIEIDNTYEVQMLGNASVDINHPLYLQMLALRKERFNTLKTIGDEISFSISKNNQIVDLNFVEKLNTLISNYNNREIHINLKIENELKDLYQEHSNIPYEQFIDFTDSTKLTPLLNIAMKENIRNSTNSNENISMDDAIGTIKKSKDYLTLKENVQNTVKYINIEHLKNPDLLINYQDIIHNVALQKISHFLFSRDSEYLHKKPNLMEKMAFLDTLEMAWVTEPDVYDYFLEEFERATEVN